MSQTIQLQRWFDELWNNNNETAIDELLHVDAVIHGLQTDKAKKGPEAFKPFYKNFREGFPDVHVELEPIISTDEFEAAHCLVTAKNAEGKDVKFTGITIAKFKDGKLIEGWNGYDFLSMYEQLGFKLIQETV
ncbi:MAG: ester cyclase [Ferruginibacter sp.]